MYLPFIAWWDPQEAKWFVIPNLFLAALLAHSVLGFENRRWPTVVVSVVTLIVCAVNFESTIWPRRVTPNPNLELARCVSMHVQPGDAILAADWSFAGYGPYFFDWNELNFIAEAAWVGNPEATLRNIRQRVGELQYLNGNAYIRDVASYSKTHLDWLYEQTSIRVADLERFQGDEAFECDGVVFRTVPRMTFSYVAAPPRIRGRFDLSLGPSAGRSLTTVDLPRTTSVGYAELNSDQEKSGFSILEFRSGGSLLSQVPVPLTDHITSGLTFVETGREINTAVGIANANNRSARVEFYFSDSDGIRATSGVLNIPPGGHISRYLTEEPFNAPTSVLGTFSFTADVPISVTAMRTINGRSGFQFSRIPTGSLDVKLSLESVIPFFKVGDGSTSDVVMMNPTKGTLRGRLQFVSEGFEMEGIPETTYVIPSRGVRRLKPPLGSRSGYIRVRPEENGPAPITWLIFGHEVRGIPRFLTSVEAVESRASLKLYVIRDINESESITTRPFIVNTSSADATVQVDLAHLDGQPVLQNATYSIAPGKVWSIEEIVSEGTLPATFEGVLTVRSISSQNLVGLSLVEHMVSRLDFMVNPFPPFNPFGRNPARSGVFPQIVNGGGYSTRFVLLNESDNPSSVSMEMRSTSGQLMPLPFR
jgi:hypothetical protein